MKPLRSVLRSAEPIHAIFYLNNISRLSCHEHYLKKIGNSKAQRRIKNFDHYLKMDVCDNCYFYMEQGQKELWMFY